MLLQRKNVRDIFNITHSDEFFNINRSEPLDVHGVSSDKIDDVALQLRRAVRRCTLDVRRIAFPLCLRPAHRTDIRYHKALPALRALFFPHFLHLRNDLAGFVDDDGVPDSDIQIIDKVLIVKRRPRNASSIEPYRLKYRSRRDPACPSDRQLDIQKLCLFFLRRIFVGDRPSGHFRGCPELLPVRETVDLDHRSVDVIAEVAAVLRWR